MLSWDKTETNFRVSRVVFRTRKTVYFSVSMHTLYIFVCILSSGQNVVATHTFEEVSLHCSPLFPSSLLRRFQNLCCFWRHNSEKTTCLNSAFDDLLSGS